MPRNGSGVYSPDWVNASPNTTIESAKQNAMIADLVTDANAARPITAGGTGGATAAAARTALAVPGLATENVFTKTQIWAKGADVASAAALNTTDDGNYFDITGTTSITSIVTVGVGAVLKLHFDGILTLTHHATDLILPGAANITTAAGDEAEFIEYATGDWRCTNYQGAVGGSWAEALVGSVVQSPAASYVNNTDITASIPFDDTIPQSGEGTQIASLSITPLSATDRIEVTFSGQCTMSVTGSLAVTLFKTGSADAIGSGYVTVGTANFAETIVVVTEFVAGTTSAITIVARAGVTAGAGRFNGNSAGRLFGGSSAATLRVKELKAS